MSLNSVEIHAIRASLVRLVYGTHAEIDSKLESRVNAIVRKYVMDSSGRELSEFLIQPILGSVADYPQRPAPYNVLTCILLQFQKWKNTKPVLLAATVTLKTLVALFSSEERLPTLSHKIYTALQACVQILEGRLKPPAVDGVASVCFKALESKDWTHKVGAMDLLATLVRCSRNTEEGKENSQRTLLTDFLDLAAITAQRQAHYDPSKRVREAAFSLLSTIECPVDTLDSKLDSKKENSAESVEPVAINSTTKSTNNSTEKVLSPIPLALTPLPAFSKELSEDELCRRKETVVAALPVASPSVNRQSPDAFSMLESDMQSINSAIEMDIENFLRGSILPASDFEKLLLAQQEEQEEEEDAYSEGWDDVLNQNSSFSYNNNEEEESGNNFSSLINQVLVQALEEHFKQDGTGATSNLNLTAQDIEKILRTCLDLHSEQAYEVHLQRAEALLVRSSLKLQGKPQADVELQRQVQVLEQDVHRAVAEQQAQFMGSVLPEIADILTNPQMLERLLGC